MATLVLTAVGTLVGGPIGAAVGGLVGSQIDAALFSPKGAKGARLANLAVQGSSYGAELPRVFGTMRLAGTVIWATDLVEDSHRSGGKGRPKTTTYSYSTSFGVALSTRTIRRVGRIWADGNLLRGSGGDWKSELGAFRLHTGGEEQAADPLIAAAEGIDATPAYRGIAYAVFEHLQLADFGNRIPSLSFEVIADDGTVDLATIAGELSAGAVRGAGGPVLSGYAAAGDSVRGAIEGLAQALPVAFAAGAAGLALVDETAAAAEIGAGELGAREGDTRVARLTIDRAAAGTLNEALTIAYADPARDGQAGTQGARRGAAARRTGTIELPAAVPADAARAIAEARLAREWAGRERATVTLPRRRLDLAAGAIVTLPGHGGRWRVTRRTFDAAGVTIEAVRLPGGGSAPIPAAPGRAVAAPDRVQGPTRIEAIDLPIAEPGAPPTLRIAAGGGPGWRRATVIGSADGGATWPVIGVTAPPAVLGVVILPPPPGAPFLVDEAATIEVTLDDATRTLSGDDQLGWDDARNLALVGEELIQFGVATALGGGRWRLARLLRGRRGTEWAMASHLAHERFVLIEAATLLDWPMPVPAESVLVFADAGRLPPSPVAVRAARGPDGTLAIGWTRRSRDGWAWLEGADVPLVEEAERYRVEIGAQTIETDTPFVTIAAPPAGPIAIAVTQIGTYGASRAARLALTGD